jgi:hypothetical protein
VFRFGFLLGLILAVTLAQGCGYRVVRPAASRGVTVSVVTLDNDSVEPGIELTVTRALRKEFLRRAAPRLVSNPSAADLVIRGRVLPLETRANSFDTVALALEYRVELTLDLEVSTSEGEAVGIDAASLRQSELYLASADAEATRKNRDEALRRIADILAGRVHDAIGLQLADRSPGPETETAETAGTEPDGSKAGKSEPAGKRSGEDRDDDGGGTS